MEKSQKHYSMGVGKAERQILLPDRYAFGDSISLTMSVVYTISLGTIRSCYNDSQATNTTMLIVVQV